MSILDTMKGCREFLQTMNGLESMDTTLISGNLVIYMNGDKMEVCEITASTDDCAAKRIWDSVQVET